MKTRCKNFLLLLTILITLQLLLGCAVKTNLADDSIQVFPAGTLADVNPKMYGELTISFIDVGQGDCTFIVLPDGQTMLIDAGGHNFGEKVIEYIKSFGKNTLDYVIATHPHADHIGGLPDIINTFDIKNIYLPKAEHTTATYEKLLDTVAEKGLCIQTARAGKTLFAFGSVKAEFLAPQKDSYQNINNSSAVIMLSYGDKRFLFMGDAQKELEADLLKSGEKIPADVLRVGHHGSKTSSSPSFIQAVNPSIAVISVGKGNSYGHPCATVLKTLEDAQAEVHRTDEEGTIIITCDSENITLHHIADIVQPNAPPSPLDHVATTPDTQQEAIVYITKAGQKYHLDGCKYLSKSKIPIQLDRLDATKYSPCSVCKPPAK